MKRQATDWKKVFASHTSDKGLVFKTCRELSKCNEKSNTPKRFKQIHLWLTRETMKGCSVLLDIKQTQIRPQCATSVHVLKKG